jgi:hypothetical protein
MDFQTPPTCANKLWTTACVPRIGISRKYAHKFAFSWILVESIRCRCFFHFSVKYLLPFLHNAHAHSLPSSYKHTHTHVSHVNCIDLVVYIHANAVCGRKAAGFTRCTYVITAYFSSFFLLSSSAAAASILNVLLSLDSKSTCLAFHSLHGAERERTKSDL